MTNIGTVHAERAEAGAPLDHVNNLGWTALMEAVVLGDGGSDHQEVVRLLEQQDDLTEFFTKKVQAAQIHKNPYFCPHGSQGQGAS